MMIKFWHEFLDRGPKSMHIKSFRWARRRVFSLSNWINHMTEARYQLLIIIKNVRQETKTVLFFARRDESGLGRN